MKYDKRRNIKKKENVFDQDDYISKSKTALTQKKTPERQVKITESIKRHKKRRRKNYFLYYLFMGFLLAVIGMSLSLTVFFKIENINIYGTTDITKEEIIKLGNFSYGDNMFCISLHNIEKKLISANNSLDSVDIKRKLPNSLEINIVPAKAVIIGRYASMFYHISDLGRIIKIETENQNTNVVNFGGVDFSTYDVGNYIIDNSAKDNDENTKMLIIKNLIQEINKINWDSKIKYIEVSDISSVKLYYDNKFIIKIGNDLNLEDKLSYAKKVIETELSENDHGILDVAQFNSIYFKPDNNVLAP